MLGFDTVLNRVSKFALSPMGREQIQQLDFITDPDLLRTELNRVTEMRDLLQYGDPFPLESFEDIKPLFKKVRMIGAFLLPQEFNSIKHGLRLTRQIKNFFKTHPEKYLHLEKTVRETVALPDIETAISKIVDSSNEIKDNGSPQLLKLRNDKNTLMHRIRKRLDAILQTAMKKGYAQEENLALRHGRLSVPVKEAFRGQVKGVVLDQSASGSTVFIEPLEILEMNNEVRRLEIAEQQEIEKLLKELTTFLRPNMQDVELNFKVLVELDCLYARAKYALEIRGNAALINDENELELKHARHPLLLMRENSEEVVPLTLIMPNPLKTLLVTGPNAGGKTVLLKTVGLLSLMNQHGLLVPVDEGTSLPVFSNILADIGDQQSIEKDLSTFSSHIQNLKSFLNQADSRSLILLDEIGSSTDPGEGAALATTVLRYLTSAGCKTIATTHIGVLKVFAHEEEGVENGSMAFDRQTLRPTYQFQMSIPGSSYAFEIAKRLGFPEDLVKNARTLVGKERGRLDQLILHLEEKLQNAHALLKKAEIQESKLAGLMKLYQDKLEQLKSMEQNSKEKAIEEARQILGDANALVEKTVREIRESQAEKEVIKKVKTEIETQKKKLAIHEKKSIPERHAEPNYPLKEGDWVVWKNHTGIGKIVGTADNRERVFVQYNDLRIQVPRSQLIPAVNPGNKKRASRSRYRIDFQVSPEISVRGMVVEEALREVDGYLDKAAMSGLPQVRIIHGKGEGILRKEISKHLENHPFVKKKRLGRYREGDTGVTIVELK